VGVIFFVTPFTITVKFYLLFLALPWLYPVKLRLLLKDLVLFITVLHRFLMLLPIRM